MMTSEIRNEFHARFVEILMISRAFTYQYHGWQIMLTIVFFFLLVYRTEELHVLKSLENKF